MIDNEKVGKQIALLRKEKKLTGDKLAELLSVSPQAISKWENGKCLPDTSILPLLSKTLGCSIDNILVPKKLHILNATYSDGITNIDVTQILNSYINDNKLCIIVNDLFLGHNINSARIKLLTVKYQTPQDIFYSYTLTNETLTIDLDSKGFSTEHPFKIVGAFYGNINAFNNAIKKLEHYDYFRWPEIKANHELFPSSTYTDEIEYLTILYTNKNGIFVISCSENESLYYSSDKTNLSVKNDSENQCILPNIMKLQWNNNMDCTWGGSLYAALRYMSEDITYEQLMGISGACYRIAFTEIWDWSSVDALVAFDYAKIAYKALGYEIIWADRIEKDLRKEERQRIITDLNNHKPPIAINLRVAPEWGVITGYLENGKKLLCRTYFDKDIFEAHGAEPDFPKETGGYLEADFWPFCIAHFGEKLEKPTEKETLIASLKTKVDTMIASQNRGYHQGFEAYKNWIKALEESAAWTDLNNKEGIFRRLSVNDYQLKNLIDARRCAAIYLKNSSSLLDNKNSIKLDQISEMYFEITDRLVKFYQKVQLDSKKEIEYNSMKVNGVNSRALREEQSEILTYSLNLEYKIDDMIKEILEDVIP